MFGLLRFGSLFAAFGLSAWCVAGSPSPIGTHEGHNITSTMPALSPELFKRAIASPYIFTAFTSASESNLYVYTSNDATNFSLLKGPAYTPPSGLIRDPSVILHTE
ncbi:hypothetical protein CVT24_003806 [Panaeolus cyanescens]|uniref:Uncharacterized protein n=1 Tax=Panaeolus cyanescens TaxID=181874 RepID=A0A409VUW3_9AGAR|nr:hypothetical protein CVT24_003806 [Panaeolus cyanescens]